MILCRKIQPLVDPEEHARLHSGQMRGNERLFYAWSLIIPNMVVYNHCLQIFHVENVASVDNILVLEWFRTLPGFPVSLPALLYSER